MDPSTLMALAGGLKGGGGTKVTQSLSTANSVFTSLNVSNVMGSGSATTPSSQPVNITQTPISTGSPIESVPLPILGAQPLSSPGAALDGLYNNVTPMQKTALAAGAFFLAVMAGLFLFKRRK